ncbi:MAG: hypothetical protein ABIQ59_09250 [Nocardioidaceae bacterium]
MSDVRTARLLLHAIDLSEGERIVSRRAGPGDDWAEDYPSVGTDGDLQLYEVLLDVGRS